MLTNLIAMAAVLVLAAPAVGAAQAPTPPGPAPPGVSSSLESGEGTSGPTGLQFGAWLDDATTDARHSGRLSVGAGYWQTRDGYQIDVPMLQASYGVTDRLQFSAFVPFYRASVAGTSTSGPDDMFLSAKYVAVSAADGGRVGLAVSPTVEILGANATSGNRVHWALPISVELRAGRTRAYAASGYFSRGAVFGGAAVEWTLPGNLVAWAAATHSYSLRTATGVTVAANERHRVDGVVGLAGAVTTRVAAYASVGRTLSAVSGGATVGVAGGISIAFVRAAAP